MRSPTSTRPAGTIAFGSGPPSSRVTPISLPLVERQPLGHVAERVAAFGALGHALGDARRARPASRHLAAPRLRRRSSRTPSGSWRSTRARRASTSRCRGVAVLVEVHRVLQIARRHELRLAHRARPRPGHRARLDVPLRHHRQRVEQLAAEVARRAAAPTPAWRAPGGPACGRSCGRSGSRCPRWRPEPRCWTSNCCSTRAQRACGASAPGPGRGAPSAFVTRADEIAVEAGVELGLRSIRGDHPLERLEVDQVSATTLVGEAAVAAPPCADRASQSSNG